MRIYPRKVCHQEAQAHIQINLRNEQARLAFIKEEQRLQGMGWEETSNEEQQMEGNTVVTFLNQTQNACQYWGG